MELEGRIALITGGSGLALATARAFTRGGAQHW